MAVYVRMMHFLKPQFVLRSNFEKKLLAGVGGE